MRGTGSGIPTLFVLYAQRKTHHIHHLTAAGNKAGYKPKMAIRKMVHVGNLIKKELKRQHLSYAWLADAIYCTRPNIYKIVQRQHIDTESLTRISRALRHNFFADLAQDYDRDRESAE